MFCLEIGGLLRKGRSAYKMVVYLEGGLIRGLVCLEGWSDRGVVCLEGWSDREVASLEGWST